MIGPIEAISPVVVKELRQEMRMRSFTHFFVWTQVLMAGAVFLDMAASDDISVRSSMFASLTWIVLYASLIFMFPLRAQQSFNKEEKANSMELVLLTRLSAARLVFGKYFAIVSLGGLIVVSILPYLFLQYFLRGSDLFEALTELLLLVLSSLIITAVTLLNSAMARGKSAALFFMIGVVILGWISQVIIEMLYSSGRWFTALPGLQVSILIIYTAITVLQLLMIAASRIAPIYENYTFAKRLIALIVLALTSLFILLSPPHAGLVLTLCFVSILPIVLSSCFEQMHPLLGLRLMQKRITPWLTYSGWPQGIIFALIVLIWFNSLFYYSGVVTLSSTQRFPEFCFFAFIGLLLPRAMMLTIPAVFGTSFFAYSIIQLVMLVIGAGLGAYSYRFNVIESIPSFFPLLTAFYYLDGSNYMVDKVSAPISLAVALLTLFLLVIQAFKEVRKTIKAGQSAIMTSPTPIAATVDLSERSAQAAGESTNKPVGSE